VEGEAHWPHPSIHKVVSRKCRLTLVCHTGTILDMLWAFPQKLRQDLLPSREFTHQYLQNNTDVVIYWVQIGVRSLKYSIPKFQ